MCGKKDKIIFFFNIYLKKKKKKKKLELLFSSERKSIWLMRTFSKLMCIICSAILFDERYL